VVLSAIFFVAGASSSVGRWGKTSYTSLRASQSSANGATQTAGAKPKKFFKSRNAEQNDANDDRKSS
jgi:hypothetical protein